MVSTVVSNFVNIFAFLGLTVATYTIFYLGRMMNPTKGIGLNLFTLALGINFIGLSYLLRIWVGVSTSPIILVLVAIGSTLLSTGVIWVFYEKSMEISNLKRREREINSVIAKVKERYYKQELSEEELKSIHSNLLKELAEIEVKLSERRK